MGRKIPGAKHHGVKDPIKQQERRMKLLKQKINAPPTHPDDQPIPKSLTRLFEFKEKQENRMDSKKNKIKLSQRSAESQVKLPNPVSSLTRMPGESARDFNQRINGALHSINKRQVHAHEMDKSLNPDNYLPEENAREERYSFIEERKMKRKIKEAKKRNKEGVDEPVKLSRMQRRALKLKEKKAQKQEESDDRAFEPQYERVRFGEVAHEPPSLHIKPKKASLPDGAPRPGRRDLLLNKLLEPNSSQPETKKSEPRITVSAKSLSIDKKAKRRSLPFGVRMRLEQSQQEAIAAYRALKADAKNKKLKG